MFLFLGMPGQPKDLFSLHLDPEGWQSLRQLFRVARWLCLFGYLGVAVFLLLDTIRYLRYLEIPSDGSLYDFFEKRIYPFYALGNSLLLGVQLFYYWRFMRSGKKALHLHDSHSFNQSFRLLLRSAWFSLALFVLNFLLGLFYLYAHLQSK